jgi:cobalamin biosynthesis Mg chelatase CobN
MPASEIDDIFSGKVAKADVLPSPERLQKTSKKKKKVKKNAGDVTSLNESESTKKSKKRKHREADEDDTVLETQSPSIDPAKKTSKKRKEKEKSATRDEEVDEMTRKQERRRVVETVRDSSGSLGHATSSQSKADATAADGPSKVSRRSKEGKDDDIARFTDSRGSGPRESSDFPLPGFTADLATIRKTNGRGLSGIQGRRAWHPR